MNNTYLSFNIPTSAKETTQGEERKKRERIMEKEERKEAETTALFALILILRTTY